MPDERQRADRFEAAMKTDLPDPRLIPYIQRHEIEALILPGLAELAQRLPHEHQGISRLIAEVAGVAPEDVNDGPETHPSRRLARYAPSFGKVADAPAIVEQIGLGRIRAACPRFDRWLTTLESLGEEHRNPGPPLNQR